MYAGIPPRAADTLCAPFDAVGIVFARLAGAPHIVHAVLDAGQMSRLQVALANTPHKRDPGCRGGWATIQAVTRGTGR